MNRLSVVSLSLLFVATSARADYLQMRIDLKLGFPDQAGLVEGTVVSTEETETQVIATVLIEHVYFGPPALERRKVTIGSPKSPGGFSDFWLVSPPLTRDERAVFLLRKRAGTWEAYQGNYYGLKYPARISEKAAFERGRAFSRFVEKISKSQLEERIELAKDAALDSAPEIAIYGVCVVVNSGLPNERAVAILKALLKHSEASIACQVTIDEGLSKLLSKEWNASDERARLFRSWLSEKHSERDLDHLYSRLNQAGQHSSEFQLLQMEFLAILQTALTNPDLSLSWKARFVDLAHHATFQYPDATPSFLWLIQILKSSDSRQLRLAAARAIGVYFPTKDAERQTALGELLGREMDAEIRKFLDKAKEHPDPKDRIEGPPESAAQPRPGKK